VTTTTGTARITATATDEFVEALRAHSRRYHDQHPFHVRMNAGRLSRRQIEGWVANRFYYQENIPRKAAAGSAGSSTTTAAPPTRAASRRGCASARPPG
jgi:pyrroloquinoline quinone (PQQ) biosynthesis protein C